MRKKIRHSGTNPYHIHFFQLTDIPCKLYKTLGRPNYKPSSVSPYMDGINISKPSLKLVALLLGHHTIYHTTVYIHICIYIITVLSYLSLYIFIKSYLNAKLTRYPRKPRHRTVLLEPNVTY